MANIELFKSRYASYKSTFKETSYDSNNKEYLCSDKSQEVINFDKIIEDKYPNSNDRPKSFDTIFCYEKYIFLIEFKNEKKPNKEEIEGKLFDGKKEIIKLLEELNISKKAYKFIFCLVYKPFKPKPERFKKGLYKSIRFEYLNKYKDSGIVNEVFTDDIYFFTKQFKKQLQKELMC